MWSPPTGPPNDVRLRPAEARRQITQAIEAAQARDRELRGQIAALTIRRVELGVELAAAVEDAAEARELAKRALLRSDESARVGQRADAARWTDAARVFALRVRDARARAAALEAQIPGCVAALRRTEAAMKANVAHLNQVALARLASLNPRKAARLQQDVEDAKAEVSAPVDFLVAATEREARAALEAAGALASAAPTVPVDVDDLEDEVDLAAADPLIEELRAELAPAEPVPEEPAPPPAADDDTPEHSRRAGTAGRR
jgi:hypothetical protein